MGTLNADERPPGLDRAHALEPKYYFGDATFELERQQVFAASWQLVAHHAELAEAGDHVLANVAGTPVVLLRAADGVLRAFPNVCRHRAGPLVLCSGKGLGNLRCKYHGWLYNQEGQLVAAPEMQEAKDFRVGDVRLPRFQVREWQGLVFVALADDVPAFERVYAGITERIAPVELGAMQFVRRDSWDIACNWKVYVDNYLEGYHVPLIHPALARVVDYRNYEVELSEWYSLQHSPLQGSDDVYGDGRAYYYFVYPNVMLNVMPGRLADQSRAAARSWTLSRRLRMVLHANGRGVRADRERSRVHQRRPGRGRRHLRARAARACFGPLHGRPAVSATRGRCVAFPRAPAGGVSRLVFRT